MALCSIRLAVLRAKIGKYCQLVSCSLIKIRAFLASKRRISRLKTSQKLSNLGKYCQLVVLSRSKCAWFRPLFSLISLKKAGPGCVTVSLFINYVSYLATRQVDGQT